MLWALRQWQQDRALPEEGSTLHRGFQMAGAQLNPLLAAWLPVLIFGPFALVMTDLIRT